MLYFYSVFFSSLEMQTKTNKHIDEIEHFMRHREPGPY